MLIAEDSRQQKDKHIIKHEWFAENGHELVRSKLIFGDYSVLNNVYVDTKASMQEIAQNIGGDAQEHKRFREELILAQRFGKHLYILVENYDGIRKLSQVQYWYNPRLDQSPKAITGIRLCKAMDTMQQKYGCTFLFCRPEESAEVIVKLLIRDE